MNPTERELLIVAAIVKFLGDDFELKPAKCLTSKLSQGRIK